MAGSNTIEIIVALRDNITRGLRATEKSLKGLGNVASSVGDSILNLQNAIIFTGAVAAIGQATKAFATFDDTMRAVGAVTGATTEEMGQLTEIAMQMGAETRYSATQSAEALQAMGMAGMSATDQIGSLPSVLQLAAAGNLDLGRAADITTNILTGYGLKVEDLGEVNDVLVKGFTSTNSTLEELGVAFTYVGPIAAGLGVDFNELVATLGGLHNAGIKGSMAGTSLRGALEALYLPTEAEAEIMKTLGERIGQSTINVKDADGKFIGFAEVIKQLELAGVSADEALALFGLRAGPGMAALLNQGSASLEKLTDKLDDSGGTAARIADEMEAGIGGAIRALISAFESFQIAVGKALSDEIGAFVQFFRDELRGAIEVVKQLKEDGSIDEWAKEFSAAFREAYEGAKEMAAAVLGFLKEYQPQIKTLIGLAPEILAIGGAATVAGAGFSTLGMAIGGLASGIGGLSGLFGQLTDVVHGSEKAMLALKAAGVLAIAALSVTLVVKAIEEYNKMKKAMEGAAEAAGRFQESAARLIEKTKEFKDIRLPEDFAEKPFQELKKLGEELQNSRRYWKAVEMSMEDTRRESWENQKAWAAAKEKVAELDQQLGLLKDQLAKPQTEFLDSINEQFETVTRSYENHVEVIKKAEESGAISHAEATERKRAVEMQWLTDRTTALESAMAQAETLYGQDSAAYIAAVEQKKAADAALHAAQMLQLEGVRDASKLKAEFLTAANIQEVESTEAATEKKAELYRADIEASRGRYDQRLADVDAYEKKGIVRTHEAVKERMEAEVDFTRQRVGELEKQAASASLIYGFDSQEYRDSIGEKRKAEADWTSAVNNLTDERVQRQVSANDEVEADMKETHGVLRKLFETPLVIEIDTDPARAALEALAQTYKQEQAEMIAFAAKLQAESRSMGAEIGHLWRQQSREVMRDVQKLGNEASSALGFIADQVGQHDLTVGNSFNRLDDYVSRDREVKIDTTQAEASVDRLAEKVSQPMDANISFTGTGSSTRPLSEKVPEMIGKIGEFSTATAKVAGEINTNFAGITGGFSGAVNRAVGGLPSVGSSGGGSARGDRLPGAMISPYEASIQALKESGLWGMKDLGKTEIQMGGAAYPVMGSSETIGKLQEHLRRERLTKGK